MTVRPAVALLAALSLAACQAPGSADAPPRWRAETVRSIGSVDGPDALSPVRDLAVGPDGGIYVVQARARTILVFGPEGSRIDSIGGPGEGPGEFRGIGRIGWTGDTLWAVGVGKLHLFDRSGDFLEAIRLDGAADPESPRRVVRPGPLNRDGSILGVVLTFGEQSRLTHPVLRVARDGTIEDTLAWSAVGQQVQVDLPGGRWVRMQHPLPDAPLWKEMDGGQGLVTVERPAASSAGPTTFRVTGLGASGDTLFSRTLPYEPVPLSPEEEDALLDELAARHRSRGTPAAVRSALEEGLDLPAFHPPVSDLVPGRDGTVWLRREERSGDGVDWLVLDREGRELSQVRLPADLRVLRARAGRVWGVVADELDVPYVRVYDISGERPEAG